MKYRLRCLTPVLVGDGSRLSPIDYMVWKDQVNVLDQRRIFRLLAKGPRLDSYLTQIKRAEKLDFASWGGFAQNFAGRRIPFEHASMTGYWERLRAEHLHIPTFLTGPAGPYLPGSALKGALRTAAVGSLSDGEVLKRVAAEIASDRPPRRPAERPERGVMGSAGLDRMRAIRVADSAALAAPGFKVFLLRTATLEARAPAQLALAWKQSPSGSVEPRRIAESTPIFAEMAPAGTVFEGTWTERSLTGALEAASAPEPFTTAKALAAANDYAARLLAIERRYVANCGLPRLAESVDGIEGQLREARKQQGACLLPIGWGAGFLSKSAWPDSESALEVLRQLPIYAKAVRTGLPFPKTRRIGFLGDQPAFFPGWAVLQTEAW